MLLLDRLFGKREKAVVENAVPPPSGSLAETETKAAAAQSHVAPGTSIPYHPELIDKLTGDHQVLLKLFGETKAAAGSGNVALAAARLEEFRIALQAHLLTENIRLYVYLEHALAADAKSHTLVHEFRHEMDGIGKAVVGFLGKYRDLAARPELAADFSSELDGVGKVLVERIQREESTLYPLYAA